MLVAFDDVTIARDVKPLKAVREAIEFRRNPRRAADLDQRPVEETGRKQFVIEFQPTYTWRKHTLVHRLWIQNARLHRSHTRPLILGNLAYFAEMILEICRTEEECHHAAQVQSNRIHG